MTRHVPLRVVKLGGSLLSWKRVARVFHAWLDQQPRMRTLVVVGGGPPVQRLRQMARLGPVTAHWLAIECMDDNVRKFAARAQLPLWESDLMELIAMLQTSSSPSPLTWIVASVRRMQQQLDAWPGLARLPRSWDVTSDSIAAQLGTAVGCRELALLKSCEVPVDLDCEILMAAGIVDGYFPRAAENLAVRLVNLRGRVVRPQARRNRR